MDFLQKPLAWFSSFYIRVQSKICGRNSFCLFFLSELFRISNEMFFRLFAKNCQKFVKTTFYVSRGTICGLKFFLSSESLPIFCSNHWHGSQNSIYVSGVKNAEKNMFFCFSFQNCFEFWAIYFQTFGQNTSKVFKTIFCVSRGTICGLNFFKFWIVSDFLQKPLTWFSKFYLRVQSKNCGKNSFVLFFFSQFFFRILSDIFSDFWPKHFKSFQNYFLRVQRNHLCL